MKKDNLKSIIVLSCICLVVAVLMGAVNYITSPVISDNEEKKVQDSLKSVMPDATGFTQLEELPENAPKTVKAVYRDKEETGFAVSVATESSYSSNPMTFTVALDNDGKIIAVTLTGYSETKDFGKETYPQTYVGADASSVEGVDLCSGVTYSSTAFKEAMKDVFTTFDMIGGGK